MIDRIKYTETHPTQFALLLLGEPKSGKTTLAMAFPNVGIIDADRNLGPALARYPKKDFRIATIDVDDEGKEVPRTMRWNRLVQQLGLMVADPWIKTLIIDPIGKIHSYLCDHIINEGGGAQKPTVIGGEIVMNQQYWYPYSTLMERLITKCRSSGKQVIVTSHLRQDKDEVTGIITYKPTVSGQTGDRFGGFFTDVWLCEARPDSSGTRYLVRTAPTSRVTLGKSVVVPDDWIFDYELLRTQIEKESTP